MLRGLAAAVFVAGSVVALSASLRAQEPATAANVTPVRSGAELFAQSGCTYCHGKAGEGVSGKGPALTGVGRRLAQPQIAAQIHDGGKLMPAFADALSAEELAELSRFLAEWKQLPAKAGKKARAR